MYGKDPDLPSKGGAWRPAQGALRPARSVAVLVRDAIRNVLLKPRTAGPVAIWDGERSVRPSITIASTISPDAARESVFVDSGAWIAPVTTIRYMPRREANGSCCTERAHWFTCHRDIHNILHRHANRDVALTWKEAIYRPAP
jgi:hypothetical protein